MTTQTQSNKILAIRKQFPILNQTIDGNRLIYFDNAATSQTHQSVIDELVNFYQYDHANIHRGIHTLAERSTTKYEATRDKVKTFINASHREEVIFTSGTTDSINLVAQAWGSKFLKEGDEILVSQLEHHSNIVPWQIIANTKGATVKAFPINKDGEVILDELDAMLNERVKMIAVNYVSNALGIINPIHSIIQLVKKHDCKILVDAAQATPHLPIDIQAMDCDFLAFSSHKMYGPTGVGVLYGKKEILNQMNPFRGGGEMIANVSFDGTTYNELPYKFEAGTPNIGDVIAFSSAISFIEECGYEIIQKQENNLLTRAIEQLESIDGFTIYGHVAQKTSVLSFNVEGIHPFDIGQLLDARGIAVRTGHHCTQPLMEFFEIEGTVRASFACYNLLEEVDFFCTTLSDIIKKLR